MTYLHFIQSQFIVGNTLVVHLCMEVKKHQYVFLVFITSMVISSIVFHLLTQNQNIQASGISAIGYAFVTGGVMSMFSICKNFNLGLKLFYILLIVLSLTMLLPSITGWISTFLHMSGIASYIMVSSINNYRLS